MPGRNRNITSCSQINPKKCNPVRPDNKLTRQMNETEASTQNKIAPLSVVERQALNKISLDVFSLSEIANDFPLLY